jgi:carboxymethylenebutenolidase
MERKHASDFPPEVLKLLDGYVHGVISRRDFLDRAEKYAIGGFTAAMLESLRPNYAFAQQVAKDDAGSNRYLTYPSPRVGNDARIFRPARESSGKLPGVVVIHENRGLNPYIEDVTRRLAVANFVAFAPDALTPLGGYPGDEERRQLWPARRASARGSPGGLRSAEARPECTGKGWWAFALADHGNMFAVRLPDLARAVPSHGGQPNAADVARSRRHS